jgi:hypothetical protein
MDDVHSKQVRRIFDAIINRPLKPLSITQICQMEARRRVLVRERLGYVREPIQQREREAGLSPWSVVEPCLH